MWLERGDSIFAQLVDDLQVACEGVWVLIVFCGNVGLDCIGEQQVVSPAKGNRQDVAIARHAYRLCRWYRPHDMKEREVADSVMNRNTFTTGVKSSWHSWWAGPGVWRSYVAYGGGSTRLMACALSARGTHAISAIQLETHDLAQTSETCSAVGGA